MNITQFYLSDESEDIVAVKGTVRSKYIDRLSSSISNLSLNPYFEIELESRHVENQNDNDEMNQNLNKF